MKYKIGDKVRIKSKEWWNAQPKNMYGSVDCGAETFTELMTDMCGKIVEIRSILEDAEKPHISERLLKSIIWAYL